jgi:hypothetical protein
VKVFITASYSARRGPIDHKPAVIRITAGYLKTIDEGPGVELYMQVELVVSCCSLHDEQQPLYIHINGRIKIIVHHGICFDPKMVQ